MYHDNHVEAFSAKTVNKKPLATNKDTSEDGKPERSSRMRLPKCLAKRIIAAEQASLSVLADDVDDVITAIRTAAQDGKCTCGSCTTATSTHWPRHLKAKV